MSTAEKKNLKNKEGQGDDSMVGAYVLQESNLGSTPGNTWSLQAPLTPYPLQKIKTKEKSVECGVKEDVSDLSRTLHKS